MSKKISGYSIYLIFILLTFSVTSFLPEAGGDTVISGRGWIMAALKAATFILALVLLSPSVVVRGLRNPAVLVMLGLGAFLLLSSTWSSDPTRALGKSLEFIIVVVSAAGLGRALRESHQAIHDQILNMVLIVIGLYFIDNYLLYGDWMPFRVFEQQDRVRFIFGNNHPLVTGRVIGYGLSAIIAKSIIDGSVLRRVRFWVIAIGLSTLLWLTNSRTLIMIIGIIILGVFYARSTQNVRRILMALLLLLLAFLMIAMLFFPEFLYSAFSNTTGQEILSINGRVDIWKSAVSTMEQMPWYGYGYQSHDLFLPSDQSWVTHAHNTFIELLFSIGYFGTIFFIAIWAIFIKHFSNFRTSPFPALVALVLSVDSLLSVGLTVPSFDLLGFVIICAFIDESGADV